MFREQRQYGNDPEVVRRSKTKFREPTKWAEPKRIFSCSWSDWFHEAADEWRAEAWDVVRETPHHSYLILTKRPELVFERLPSDWGAGYSNVWLGVSVENARHVWRAELLRLLPAAHRFLSCEPLLGSLFKPPGAYTAAGTPAGIPGGDAVERAGGVILGSSQTSPATGSAPLAGTEGSLGRPAGSAARGPLVLDGIDWVIVGGESGAKAEARPMHPEWAREIRDHVLASEPRALLHMKQWGSWAPVRKTEPRHGDQWLDLDGTTEIWQRGDGRGPAGDAYDRDPGSCIRNESGAALVRYAGPLPSDGGKILDGLDWCEVPEMGTVTLA